MAVILLCDADRGKRSGVRDAFAGHEVVEVDSCVDGETMLAECEFDAVISDDPELLELARVRDSRTVRYLVSSRAEHVNPALAEVAAGALHGFVLAPAAPERLRRLVDLALAARG